MILRSSHPFVALPDVKFSEYVLGNLQKHWDDILMIDADNNGKTYTGKDVYESILRCAGGLANLGVKKGDVIAVALGNRPEYPIVVVAAIACGAMLTTCNPNYTAEEITKQFMDSQPSVVFVECDKVEAMTKVAKQVKSLKHIFTAENHNFCKSVYNIISEAERRDFPFDLHIDTKESPCYLPYSSGTTGLPKGVMLTHYNMVVLTCLTGTSFFMSKRDCFYLVLPLFHMFGTSLIFSNLILGVKVVLQRRFSVESFLQSVQDYKVTRLCAVPPMMLALRNSPLISKYDTSTFKHIICSAAPLPGDVGLDVMKKFNVKVVQAWGMTEAAPLTTIDEQAPLRSIGKVAQNTSAKVVSTYSGKDLQCDECGEICVKGPQVMKGYYKNPEATRNCIDVNGWFHTGDIGYFDKYGHVFIVDRLKELIKVKGFQVAPAELEELLLSHPCITDVAVIGVPHPESGEVPKAFLVVSDKSVTAENIHQFMKGRVSSYKYLRGGIVFCDVIRKSASGKILRRELREKEKLAKL